MEDVSCNDNDNDNDQHDQGMDGQTWRKTRV